MGIDAPIDVSKARKGEWMHTSLGGRFWPADPRPEEIFISDIANGCALDIRYAGQGRVDRQYTVGEHEVHLAEFVMRDRPDEPGLAMAALLHDGAEAYINDLNRATKHAVDAVCSPDCFGDDVRLEADPANAYSRLEDPLQEMILRKYGCWDVFQANRKYLKDIDCRIVPLEKAAIMRYPQPWAFDTFEPLPGVVIQCWSAAETKLRFLGLYTRLAAATGQTPEAWEL